jgi:hypothetical protein
MDDLEGIAWADAILGRPFPLPTVPLPLARWVEIQLVGTGVEVEWNLDDSRPGSPGRLALYAGPAEPDSQLPEDAADEAGPDGWTIRRSPLQTAQESLRPVVEARWRVGGLHLRLTAQGPWSLEDVIAIGVSIAA